MSRPGLADPERALALAYAPAAVRGALAALWRLDERLGEIVRTTSEPMIGQMRLTWWHDALSGLGDATPPAEPLLAEVAANPGIDAKALLPIVDGWEELLQPFPLGDEALEAYARGRGATLFDCTAKLLGAPSCGTAGEGWALVDLAFHCSERATADRALELARRRQIEALGIKLPRALHLLAVLAAHDVRRGLNRPRRPGSPGRVARALWHGVTGL